MECHSYCLSEKVNLNQLEHHLKKTTNYKLVKHWNALEIAGDEKPYLIYIFQNGTLVSWNVKHHEIKQKIALLQEFSTNYLSKPIHESFYYEHGDKTRMEPHPFHNIDCIKLENDDKDIKLSISYALSQSIKCQYYEETLEVLIGKYSPIVIELSKTGLFNVTRSKIRMIIGEILLAKSQLNLTYNFLYRPKFFWRHPNLESEYTMVETYMEVPIRAKVINHRLNALNEIAVLCSNFLETKQSHFLELVIILLIAIEIIQSLFNLHF